MNRKTTSLTAGILLMGLAVTLTGCQPGTEQPEGSVAPLRAIETTGTEQAQVDAMVESYLDARQLLAEDRLEGVSEELAAIGQAAQPLTASNDAQVKALAQDLVNVAAVRPEDLESAREAFEEISDAMIELTKTIQPSDAAAETLYVAYCPMVKASWLQATEELANPYMGQKMLKCGEIKETIATTES